MEEAIAAVNDPGSDPEFENPKPKRRRHRRRRKSKSGSESGDSAYTDATGSSSSSESGSVASENNAAIPNSELADIQASKTAPKRQRKAKGKRKRAAAETASGTSTPKPDALDPSQRKTTQSRRTNPIYYFYETVDSNPKRERSEPGDKHYKCYHGNREVLTVTKKMNSCLNGLTKHLEKFPAVNKLYQVLATSKRKPTEDELDLCQGRKPVSKANMTALEAEIENHRDTLQKSFQKQAEKLVAAFEQKKFEELLLKWIATCDQPFDEVEKPEFRELLAYIHGRPGLKIPGRSTIQKRVMQLGTDTVEGTKAMIQELDGKVSLSLDAWTSSNQLAFLAIVMHYISKSGTLCELLIDFKEIVGSHTGENMAEAVWGTLKMYGLTGRVLAIMADNATSNDTLLDSLAKRCQAEGLPFNARQSRMRCMPHTIHLAASQLLEGIGAIKKKKNGQRGNYQEDVAVSISDDSNEAAVALEDALAEDDEPIALDADVDAVLRIVPKLRHIIRTIRGSPQRRKDWLRAVDVFLELKKREQAEQTNTATTSVGEQESNTSTPAPVSALGTRDPPTRALMLILDVVTRWSSTHQMLSMFNLSLDMRITDVAPDRAVDFRTVIDDYTARDRNDLLKFRLGDEDWAAVSIVERWLVAFRCATLAMSATKTPMLSTIHAVFRGLQESLRDDLKSLPDDCNPRLKAALLAAHKKLSDYYWKIDDESPFYLWASMLDPRIMYEGLLSDCTDEDGMTEQDLGKARDALIAYFNANYQAADSSTQPAGAAQSARPSAGAGQPFNFTARYNKQPRKTVNEIEDFLRQPREDFDTCNPIAWWVGRAAMWPRLSRMALDILTIPGSAVAVERVFSGGRDTISIRRASLKADTIRALMIIKQHYRQLRDVIELD